MTLRITLIHNGTTSINDITTDPKGNVTMRSLLLQCGITRAKNERVWIKREHAKTFRSKPLSDFSHLIKQHHEHATIVIAATMPSITHQYTLPLASPPPSLQNNQSAPPTSMPTTAPISKGAPTPRIPRGPSVVAQKKKSARDRMLRKIIQARRLRHTQTP